MDAKIRLLLAWYRAQKRDLPWRDISDPYRIFVSELMLQQTQVDRVIPLYNRFLARFPTWTSLADAKTADLIHAWAGLGYNRRALYAREAAQAVVMHGVPTDEISWRRLKGVGPYMAAALAEFANHRRALVMDTNVRRVIGRLFFRLPFPQLADDARIKAVLERVTPHRGRHWDLPQASMDLGSAICLSKSPTCDACPLRTLCASRSLFSERNRHKTLAARTPVKPTERIHRDKPSPDRIYRGRILAVVRKRQTISVDELGPAIDPTYDLITDRDWVIAMTHRLIADGLLASRDGHIITLP